MSLREWFLSPVRHWLGFYFEGIHWELSNMSNDFTTLQKDLDALKAAVAELLAKVAQGSNDQPTIDALAAEAQTILDAINPPAPAPTPAPAP